MPRNSHTTPTCPPSAAQVVGEDIRDFEYTPKPEFEGELGLYWQQHAF